MVKRLPAAVKKRAPKKSRQPSPRPKSELIRPKQLLKGRQIVLAGRFESTAAASQLKGLLTHMGGKIAKSVSMETDIVITGEGRKSAQQTKAEKLNVQQAEIQITSQDDLRHLLPSVPDDFVHYFRDPTLLKGSEVG